MKIHKFKFINIILSILITISIYVFFSSDFFKLIYDRENQINLNISNPKEPSEDINSSKEVADINLIENKEIVNLDQKLTTEEIKIDTSIKEISIPSLELNSKLISSESDKDLLKGIWHRSTTGNPIQGGNMIITAHRFLFISNNDSFYNLPNIKVNDTISLTWEGKKYDYLVTELFETTPLDISVEKVTTNHFLTLYTCTPLWTSDKRFVVRATPLTI